MKLRRRRYYYLHDFFYSNQMCLLVFLHTFRSLRCHLTSGAGDPRTTSQPSEADSPVFTCRIPLLGTGRTSGRTGKRQKYIKLTNYQFLYCYQMIQRRLHALDQSSRACLSALFVTRASLLTNADAEKVNSPSLGK